MRRQTGSMVWGTDTDRHESDGRQGERLQLALDAAGMGTWEWDLATDEVRWDATMERLFGIPEGTFGGTFEAYAALLHPDDRDRVVDEIRAAATERRRHRVEHRVQLADGSVRWIEGWGQPLLRGDEVVGQVGVAIDVTDRRAGEAQRQWLLEAEAEARRRSDEAGARLEFLSAATAVLHENLDVASRLEGIADLAVPRFADAVAVHLLDEAGNPQLAVLRHRDAERFEGLQLLAERLPIRLDAPAGAGAALRTGTTSWVPEITEELVGSVVADPDDREAIAALDLTTGVAVPLVVRGVVWGVVTFVTSAGRTFDHADVPVAEELCARAAVALDNAALHRRATELASTLQRSLLPPHLPTVRGLELGASYHPAVHGLEVGGDFYDVIRLPRGFWGIVVGDVCGKGAAAAASTALARHTIRAVALRSQSPRRILAELNDALVQHEADRDVTERLLTASFVRLRANDHGVEGVLASAGHPPAVLRRADGTLEELVVDGQLLGVFEELDLATRSFTLHPHDTVVAVTDGVLAGGVATSLIEVPELTEALAEAGDITAEALAERIAATALEIQGERPRDDIAVVAAKATTPHSIA